MLSFYCLTSFSQLVWGFIEGFSMIRTWKGSNLLTVLDIPKIEFLTFGETFKKYSSIPASSLYCITAEAPPQSLEN